MTQNNQEQQRLNPTRTQQILQQQLQGPGQGQNHQIAALKFDSLPGHGQVRVSPSLWQAQQAQAWEVQRQREQQQQQQQQQ